MEISIIIKLKRTLLLFHLIANTPVKSPEPLLGIYDLRQFLGIFMAHFRQFKHHKATFLSILKSALRQFCTFYAVQAFSLIFQPLITGFYVFSKKMHNLKILPVNGL